MLLAYGKIGALRTNLERVIRGKRAVIDLAISALLARGHLLIEDVPGVGRQRLPVDCRHTHRVSVETARYNEENPLQGAGLLL